MKKIVIGGIGILSSVILFGMVQLSAVVYSLYLTAADIGGYDSDLGVYGTALKETGTVPLFISGILFLFGIYYLIKGIKE